LFSIIILIIRVGNDSHDFSILIFRDAACCFFNKIKFFGCKNGQKFMQLKWVKVAKIFRLDFKNSLVCDKCRLKLRRIIKRRRKKGKHIFK
jgi:hypothetical protein